MTALVFLAVAIFGLAGFMAGVQGMALLIVFDGVGAILCGLHDPDRK